LGPSHEEERVITQAERQFFLEQGYLLVEGVLEGDYLERIRHDFDELWARQEAKGERCHTWALLGHPTFLELIEHPPILDRHRAVFSRQTQLLEADFLQQKPGSTFPDRHWHRDFVFPGERPLAINTIIVLDDMTTERGPTRIVPGSHRGEALPPKDRTGEPLEGEVAVECPAGSAIFINGAIWHSGARNESDGLRRGIYLWYGYWWLKRAIDVDRPVPAQALVGATPERLELLGVKEPPGGLWMYDAEP